MILKEVAVVELQVVSDSFVASWTIAYQAPLSMGFPRQEYWSGLPFLLQGILLTQGLNPGLLHCRRIRLPLSYEGSHRVGIPR